MTDNSNTMPKDQCMKNVKLIVLVLFLQFGCNVFAQKQSFDIASFTISAGWKKQKADKVLQLIKENKTTGGYCIINVYKAMDATDNAKENFDAAWESLVKEPLKIADAPEMRPAENEDGWEAQTGSAAFETDSAKGVAILVASTGYDNMVSILVLTNTDAYEKELNSFFESISFKKPLVKKFTPPATNTINTSQNKQGSQGGFAYSTTNFDDGWNSVIQEDWVLVSKEDIKVYLWFALPYNASDFTGTGVVDRDYYWDNYVSKYFTIETKQYKDNGEVLGSLKPTYVEGWATDKQTGERRFIGMRLDIAPNTAYITIGSAKDEASLWKQFPKANGGAFAPSDLSNMGGYNKFAITANDVLGTWQDGNTNTAQWYYTAASGYEGYAGMTVAARSASFTFNTGGDYASIHNGASGAVGAMNTFQQNYKGKYTVTNWNLTATNRFKGKTDSFEAWFVAVRGGRILKLKDGSMLYSLVKAK